MSTAKSNLYTIEIHGATVREHLKVSKYTEGSIPFRYLGIPLAAIKLKVSSYAPFMDKISVSVCSWTSSSVSYAGRAKHVRSVLKSVEYFWLSIFSILPTVTF